MKSQTQQDLLSRKYFNPTVESIIAIQMHNGLIPWLENGIADPWTHVENAMAIDIGNYHAEAAHAYEWLVNNQLPDGSWYASYQNGKPHEMHKVSHVIAYIAVGVWHHYLVTGDISFIKHMWPSVRKAINFVLDMRGPYGEIYWARDNEGMIYPNALIAGCSSIYLSIKCAISIALAVGEVKPLWKEANAALARAIKKMPFLFDSPERSEDIFAMDWYYPVMCSVIDGNEAKERLFSHWERFVIHGFGSLCSLTKDWVTAAETSELAMALAIHGEYKQSATILNWLHQMRDEDGAYWYGVALPQNEIWPVEKPTWTSAAVIMAADMLRPMSPTNLLLDHHGIISP